MLILLDPVWQGALPSAVHLRVLSAWHQPLRVSMDP
jgi:hypothetical protein